MSCPAAQVQSIAANAQKSALCGWQVAYFECAKLAICLLQVHGTMYPHVMFGGMNMSARRLGQGLPLLKATKSILAWSFLTCLVFGTVAAGSARADTVLLSDLTEGAVTVSSTNPSRISASCGLGDSCTVSVTAPGPFATTVGTAPFFIAIGEPGTDLVSERFFFVFFATEYQFQFVSYSDAASLGTCTQVGRCQLVEDGTAQEARTVTWSDGTVDSIQFQSDVETSATPEPGTLALFGSGLISVLGLMRRKILTQM